MWLLSLVSLGFAATGQDLADAMDVPAADLISATLTAPAAAAGEATSLGVITPTAPTNFAGLSTGILGSQSPMPGQDFGAMGVTDDYAILSLELLVPPGTNSLGFDFFFLSTEYPDYVGTNYNDSFEVDVDGILYTGNVAIDPSGNDISINSVLFAVTSAADLAGTGFVGHGGTGWLTSMCPVQEGDTITMEFRIKDFGDGVYDSTALFDNFFWSSTSVPGPGIYFPPRLDYIAPKRGLLTGGLPSVIHGSRFEATCVAEIDGVEVPTSYINDKELQIIPEAHPEGLVDVTVVCGPGLSDTLGGGYFYFDESDGEVPPSIYEVSPFLVDTVGGENVTITGAGFTETSAVYVDGVLGESTFVSDTLMTVLTASHEEGLVELSVVNENGLDDARAGALMFMSHPVWPPDFSDEGGGGPGSGVDGCACNAAAGMSLWMWGLVPLLGLRRRQS
jgi:hypothetical protein